MFTEFIDLIVLKQETDDFNIVFQANVFLPRNTLAR
jgi:hypothetical protein